MSVYHFHDATARAQRVLFGRRVTVVAGRVAELRDPRPRGEHERSLGFRVDQAGRVDGIASSVHTERGESDLVTATTNNTATVYASALTWSGRSACRNNRSRRSATSRTRNTTGRPRRRRNRPRRTRRTGTWPTVWSAPWPGPGARGTDGD